MLSEAFTAWFVVISRLDMTSMLELSLNAAYHSVAMTFGWLMLHVLKLIRVLSISARSGTM